MASAFARPSEWIKVGRFEVNTRTKERRPIPGLELGPLAEDVLPEREGLTFGKAASAFGQGVADIPGIVGEGALYLANNMPQNLAAQYLSGKASDALGIEGNSYEDQRRGQQEFRDDLLDPYRRATQGIGPEIPRFSDAPVESTVLGGLRSLPQTAAIALTGGAGAMASGAQQADASYQEMKSRGVPDYIAIPASGAVGTIQGALDKIGAEGAFKGVTGNLFGRALRGGAIEGVTETGQELVGIGGESLTGKDQTVADVRDRMSSAFAGGFLSGGALGASPRIAGINAAVEPSESQQRAQALERRMFPEPGFMDYAKLAMEDPKYAYAKALTDHAQAVSSRLKREMILDKQTELALKTEWDGAKDRINADPEAAVIRLDLDGVKAGNDTLGHDVADQQIFRPMADAVHAVAQKHGIGERLRFRAGGDEFVLVAPRGIASQVVDDLKAATAPRFIEAPPGKMLDESGIPPGEAFVQYGASVGWGMDDHSADQEVYKSKAGKPERGKLIRREKAEEVVLQHEVQQAIAPPVERDGSREPASALPKSDAVQTGYRPGKKKDRYDEFQAWGNKVQAAINHYEKSDPPLAVKMRLAFADKVQEYARSQGTSVPWERDLLYEPGELGTRQQRAIGAPVDEGEAATEEATPLSAREALAGSGALMGVPVDAVNAAVDGAAAMLSRANQVRQKYFTAEGNLPVPWMQAKEGAAQNQRAAKLETDFIVKDYGKALKAAIKNGARPEEVNEATKDYIQGNLNADIPSGMKPVLDQMRTYLDESVSQELLNSGVARDPEHAATILRNKGKWLLRAFRMHTEPDFKKKMVGTPTFDRAVDDILSREDGFLQSVVESRNSLASEYGTKLAEVNAELQQMTAEPPPSGDVVPFGMGGEASRMASGVAQEARAKAVQEKLALRQKYAKKLGIAKNRATWAEKKMAENAGNQDRKAEAAGRVEEMISFDPRPLDPKDYRGLSRAWLAKRKDIRPAILDVMGVYEDPVASFVISSERAARTIGKKRMWDDIIMGSEGREISIGKPMPGLSTPIEGITHPDENGVERQVYTSDDLIEALNTAFDAGHQATGLMKWVNIANGAIKAGDTILSIPAANRNTWSSFMALAANGNLIPAMYRHGGSAFKAAAANASWGPKEWRQEAIDGNRHGVMGSNVDTRDLERYFKTIVEDPTTHTPLKSAYKWFKDFYAFGDNFAKMVTWKSERDRYARAMDLPRDDPRVMARAAEVTKRVIQNYDRASEATKFLRDFPLAGPYISFPAAVVSNVAGSIQTISEDMSSENPKIRKEGIVRGAWFLSSMAGLAFGEEMMRSAFKDPEDEERDQEIIDDVRPLLAPWNRNSSMLLWDRAGAYLRYVDMSFLNYYDTVTRPVSMLMRGDVEKQGVLPLIGATVWDTVKKVFGEERFVGAYGDVTRGPIGGGQPVANNEMDAEVQFWRYSRWGMRSLAPGTLRVLYKAYEAEQGQALGELSVLSGFKITSVNLNKALDGTLYESAKDATAIKASIRNSIYSTSTLSIPELQANVDGYMSSMTSIYSKAADNYQRAVRQGANPQEARASVSEKMDKPGKIMMALLNNGSPLETAVQRAVAFDWQKRQVALLQSVAEKQRDAMREYKDKYQDATFDELEAQRKYLEGWASQARQVVKGGGIADQQKAGPSAFGVN